MKQYRNKIRQAIISFTSKYLIDIAHDIHHLDRVCNNALFINKIENNGNDIEIIILSAYLHDFHRLCKNAQMNSKFKKVENSHQLIYDFFNLNYRYQNYSERVISIISATDKYTFSDKDKNIENIDVVSKILYDADNLDALGAIGIARAFSFGQWIDEPLFDPNYPLIDKKFSHTEKTHSVLHHFYEKLFKLENEFYTRTGKQLAKERAKYTQIYITNFLKELETETKEY